MGRWPDSLWSKPVSWIKTVMPNPVQSLGIVSLPPIPQLHVPGRARHCSRCDREPALQETYNWELPVSWSRTWLLTTVPSLLPPWPRCQCQAACSQHVTHLQPSCFHICDIWLRGGHGVTPHWVCRAGPGPPQHNHPSLSSSVMTLSLPSQATALLPGGQHPTQSHLRGP